MAGAEGGEPAACRRKSLRAGTVESWPWRLPIIVHNARDASALSPPLTFSEVHLRSLPPTVGNVSRNQRRPPSRARSFQCVLNQIRNPIDRYAKLKTKDHHHASRSVCRIEGAASPLRSRALGCVAALCQSCSATAERFGSIRTTSTAAITQTPAHAAIGSVHPLAVDQYPITTDEMPPARLPNMFITPATEPE